MSELVKMMSSDAKGFSCHVVRETGNRDVELRFWCPQKKTPGYFRDNKRSAVEKPICCSGFRSVQEYRLYCASQPVGFFNRVGGIYEPPSGQPLKLCSGPEKCDGGHGWVYELDADGDLVKVPARRMGFYDQGPSEEKVRSSRIQKLLARHLEHPILDVEESEVSDDEFFDAEDAMRVDKSESLSFWSKLSWCTIL